MRLAGPLLMLLLALTPSVCLGFATPDVDPRDPVYADIDKLVAAGLIEAVIYGQRPYTRMQVAHLLVQASQSGKVVEAPLAETLGHVLRWEMSRFAPEVKALTNEQAPAPLGLEQQLRGTYEYTNEPPAHFIPNNGNGFIEGARIQPFAYFEQGRELRVGNQFALEGESRLRLSQYVCGLVQPRFYDSFGPDSGNEAEMLQLYGRLLADNFSLTAGRKTVLWGQGEFCGLQLSSNAWPLDMVTVSNEEPGLLPGFLRWLGPVKAAFVYSDLGDTYRIHPGAYLAGVKISIEPHPDFEFSAANVTVSGGQDSPEASIAERIEDVFTFDPSHTISNRIGGFEFRVRVPPLRGTTFYLELMFDDANEDPDVLFTEETAYLFGIYQPVVDPAGRLSLRAEYHRLGLRFYRHPEFPFVRKGDILGDPLGPDSQAGYLTGAYDLTDDLALRLELAAEFRNSDIWQVTDFDNFAKDVVVEGPEEQRYRLLMGAGYWLWAGLRLEGALGYERVYNFDFQQGSDRNNFYARLGLEYLVGH